MGNWASYLRDLFLRRFQCVLDRVGEREDLPPNTHKAAVVLAAVKDASRRFAVAPKTWPSLTAALPAGILCVQVGAEGWCRSNKRIGPGKVRFPVSVSRTL